MDNLDNIYTFVINYDGGTFISQVHAKSLQRSIEIWLDIELPIVAKLAEINGNTEREIQSKLAKEKPILIEKLMEVWCNDFALRNKDYFSMTIIKTDTKKGNLVV